MTGASAASFASQLRTPKISASVERQIKQLRKMLATLEECEDGKGYAVADDHSRMWRQPRWKRRNSGESLAKPAAGPPPSPAEFNKLLSDSGMDLDDDDDTAKMELERLPRATSRRHSCRCAQALAVFG